jgi:hypothetical protein
MPLGRYTKSRGKKLNGTHQHLVYIDDVNLLSINIKNTEALLIAGKEDGLVVSADKIEHIFMSHQQEAGKVTT